MRPVYVEFNSISADIGHSVRVVSVRLDVIAYFVVCNIDECQIGGGTFIGTITNTWLVKETYDEVKALVNEAIERQLKG